MREEDPTVVLKTLALLTAITAVSIIPRNDFLIGGLPRYKVPGVPQWAATTSVLVWSKASVFWQEATIGAQCVDNWQQACAGLWVIAVFWRDIHLVVT